MKSIIQIENLSVGFQKSEAVLHDLNLNVREGEIIAIVGENGAGKSTLLKTICKLLKPLQGEVKLLGKNITSWNANDLAKEMVFVSAQALPGLLMTVEEFVAFGRYPYSNWLGKVSSEDHLMVEESLVRSGTAKLKHKRLGELSDGEKQKVALARAFAQNTPVLLLDEPTTHLDIRNTNTIFKLLQEAKQQLNKTIVFSSHQVERAIKIADKIWVVHEKNVLEVGPQDCYENLKIKEIIFGEED